MVELHPAPKHHPTPNPSPSRGGASIGRPVNAPLYTIEVLRLAAALPEPQPLAAPHGRAEERSPTCGSTVTTIVQLDDADRIAAISQQVHACAFGQASAALVAAHAAGRTGADIDAALDGLRAWLDGSGEPPHWPGIEALAPARSRRSRHGAVLLPFRALRSAIRGAST